MKDIRLNFRLTQSQNSLIRRAAEVTRKSVSEFILESACVAAENAILNQRVFLLDEDAWNQFQKALDGPAVVKPGLKRLMEEKSPWEQSFQDR